ncbi:MAG TPA: beta-ketoacyl-[acyl-carrier-protein] synthase family protein [Candidatus Wunengus sp. YC63]|uniref:beta-ketoacyl-[acyl-carrier-protein] synthase family protein n=1 Tax=Candidatus Wunengus sp. YC63 TaxID=3367699 RepID=UPI004026323C
MNDSWDRIVITGVGLVSPIGNNLKEFRKSLLEGRSGVRRISNRLMDEVFAGVCEFDELKYQSKKNRKKGTRSGSIGIFCANEAITDSEVDFGNINKSRVGVYVGITDHGAVEMEEELFAIKEFNYDTSYWSHHFGPKVISNNPGGEIALNLGITGPHYTIGSACAAGNVGLIHGVQMLLLHEVDFALAGGVSEATSSVGYFACFKNQNALAHHSDPAKACRPFDVNRNGIVISEGGCLFTLERLSDAVKRGANIYAEVVGYGINTDATDHVAPNSMRQSECMSMALNRAGISPQDIDLINTHATSTPLGDKTESLSINKIFGDCEDVYITNTKSFIGHAMGAAGALELAGELLTYEDGLIHHTLNLENLDPACAMKNIVKDAPIAHTNVDYILNNAFGMLGINSTVIVKRYGK